MTNSPPVAGPGALPMRGVGLIALVACLAAASTAAAQGDDMDRAREAYSRGQQLFDEGDYVAARAAFQESMDAFPHYRTIFNIALCEEKLARFAEAVKLYQRYVDWPGDVPNRAEVKAKIEQLRELLPPAPEVPPKPSAEADEPEPGPDLRVPGWTSIGVGAAGLITGGVLLGLAQARANDVENVQGEAYDPDVHDAMLDEGRTLERAGWVVGAVGAAAVAVGVTLLLLSDSPEEPEETEEQPASDGELSAGLTPLRGGLAVGARWSF